MLHRSELLGDFAVFFEGIYPPHGEAIVHLGACLVACQRKPDRATQSS